MGDPRHFHIKKGTNPHTRNWLGLKKRVNRHRAMAQWEKMVQTLRGHGVEVHVIPAMADLPGLVFPANAGMVLDPEDPIPLKERTYLLANLNVDRAPEQRIYKKILTQLGVDCFRMGNQFEGEADLFPWGKFFIFTFGKLRTGAWQFKWSFPPYQRVCGFRSDQNGLPFLKDLVAGQIISLELVKEDFYHGDTVLCSFGPERKYLLAYGAGIHPRDREKLAEVGKVLWLEEQDAQAFAANSFYLSKDQDGILFMPEGVSADLRNQIEKLDVETVTIEVSEFFRKGGGSVKCMIGDLGRP